MHFALEKKNEAKICFAGDAEKFIRTILLLIIELLSFHVFDVSIQSLISCEAGKQTPERKGQKSMPFYSLKQIWHIRVTA